MNKWRIIVHLPDAEYDFDIAVTAMDVLNTSEDGIQHSVTIDGVIMIFNLVNSIEVRRL